MAHRVRAHVFLCLLAYYVKWHMHWALALLLFGDADKKGVPARRESPVAPRDVYPKPNARRIRNRRRKDFLC